MDHASQEKLALRTKERKNWVNILFLAFVHVLATLGVWWSFAHFSWATIVLTLVWGWLCSISITAGYHRLFAHPTYEVKPWIRAIYLCFGAASVQNSALKWSADHRRHPSPQHNGIWVARSH